MFTLEVQSTKQVVVFRMIGQSLAFGFPECIYTFFVIYIYIYTYLCIYVHLLDTTGIRLKIDSSHQTFHTLGILEAPSRRNQPTDDCGFVSMCSPFFTGVRYGKGFKTTNHHSSGAVASNHPLFQGQSVNFRGFNFSRQIGKKT